MLKLRNNKPQRPCRLLALWPPSFVHAMLAEEEADIRQLIGLYYAERAADLVDAQWDENGWTPETMHRWVREHLRTAHGRQGA